MKKIIFATGNEGKMVEIRDILADCGYEIITMKQAGIDLDIFEYGLTFEGNAKIKAKAIAACPEAEGCIVLADDSGLEIDYLDKNPGIFSARWPSEELSNDYDAKNSMIIEELKGVPTEKRTARYVCAVAAAFPDGRVEVRRGTVEGIIAEEIVDKSLWKTGFGFDPIFYVPEYGKTTAEMEPEEKNNMSHRGNALRAIKEII